jgi:hypothetical protein
LSAMQHWSAPVARVSEAAKQPTWPAGSQPMAVIFGTQGRDTLPGTNLDDVIRGWAEDGDPSTDLGDELRGFDGNDTTPP